MRIRPANILNLVLILGLAVLIWFFVQQEIVETSEVEFKVYFQLPENQNLIVTAYSVGKAHNPEKVTLKLRGSKAKLTELLLSEMKELSVPIAVKESDIPPDKPYRFTTLITDDMLHLPSNVTLTEKIRVDVVVDALAEGRVCSVKLNAQGGLGDFPPPPKVIVSGPRSLLTDKFEVLTERIDNTTFRNVKERNLMLLNHVADYMPGARPDLVMGLDQPSIKVTQPEQKVEVERTVQIKLLGSPEFLNKWRVEIQGDMTRTLYIVVPENMKTAAQQRELELVLDLTSFSYDDPKIPFGPVALKLLNKPDWMELTKVKDETGAERVKTNMEVTIKGFKESKPSNE